MKKLSVIILVSFTTILLNILVKVYYSKIYDGIDINTLSAEELNNNFFKKYLIMNMINIIGTIFVFVITRRQKQSKPIIFLTAILFFFITSIITRYFL